MKRKLKGECHFAYCKKIANYGFIHRKSKRIQTETYCREHAYKIRSYKAFPECRLIRVPKKSIIIPPNIMGNIDLLSEEKQREVIKELLK